MKLPASFDSFRSRSDGSYGLSFSTQEASPAELADLGSHRGLFGWLVFSEAEIQEEDIPNEQVERDDLSPTQRLYNVLFVLHKQLTDQGKTDEPFRIWREKYMERLINKLKEKLV